MFKTQPSEEKRFLKRGDRRPNVTKVTLSMTVRIETRRRIYINTHTHTSTKFIKKETVNKTL